MKRIGISAEHPYFDDNNLVDIPTVRANVGKILNSFKTLAPVEKETEQKPEVEATTNTVQEQIESDTKTEEEVSVEDSTQDVSDEAEPDKREVKAEPTQTQEETEAASGQDDTVETNSEKNAND